MTKFILSASVAAVAVAMSAGASMARDQLQIAGSSTVLPYAKIVAENFGEAMPDFKTPVVESGGSSAGLKEFCKGVGLMTQKIPERVEIIDVMPRNPSGKVPKHELRARIV